MVASVSKSTLATDTALIYDRLAYVCASTCVDLVFVDRAKKWYHVPLSRYEPSDNPPGVALFRPG